MKDAYKRMMWWLEGCPRAGFICLLFSAAVISGCAGGGKVVQESVDEIPPAPEKTTVSRLADGREGFIIREPQTMDSESRSGFERATALLKEGAHDRAIELFEEVIVHSPDFTAPHVNISMAYRETGQTEVAEEHLKAALDLVPGHPVASNEYGRLLRREGRFEEARAVYEMSLERFPEYLPVRKNLGILCDLYLGDPTCALQQYEVCSEVRPEDEEIRIWIADLRIRLGLSP